MAIKRVDIQEIVKDLNSGMGDVPIMEKYGITPSELIPILEKLNEIKPSKESVLNRRLETLKTGIAGQSLRDSSRCYLILSVTIFDLTDDSQHGRLLDLSEKGFQVTGINSEVGESRQFRIQVEWFEGKAITAQFIAECRWEEKETADGSPLAGFQITSMPLEDRRQLQDIIRLVALCDE